MKHLRTITTVLFFFSVFVTPSEAQVTVSEFLASALTDPEVQTFDDQMTYLNGKPYRLPLLREFQFRTQNREMLSYQQEFGVRLSASNPFEISSQNEYFRELNTGLSFEKEFALKDALVTRYWTTVELIYYSDLLALTTEGANRLEEQLDILEKQSGSRYFNAEDFVELKIDQLDLTVELEELRFEVANQVHRVDRTYPQAHNKKIDWTFATLISPAKIRRVVDSLEQLAIRSSWVSYQEQRIKVSQSEYKLEKNNWNLGFIQGSYDFRRVNQDRNPYSISAGLTIPITNPNKGDMAKRKLDIIEAEYDLKEEEIESETDQKILSDKVRSLIERLDTLEKRINDLRESNLATTLSSIRGGDPVVLIQFAQNLYKLYALSLKVRRELLISYVEYLAFTGHLQKEPLFNFLSPTLQPISNR